MPMPRCVNIVATIAKRFAQTHRWRSMYRKTCAIQWKKYAHTWFEKMKQQLDVIPAYRLSLPLSLTLFRYTIECLLAFASVFCKFWRKKNNLKKNGFTFFNKWYKLEICKGLWRSHRAKTLRWKYLYGNFY